MLRGKFIAVNVYIIKEEQSEIKILTLQFKEKDKEEQTKLKANWRKEMIKIRAEVNRIENGKTIDRINKAKSWFFEMINKIDKSFARLREKKRKLKQRISEMSMSTLLLILKK